ncbi:MAG: ferrous iron transport protein A [Bdellovibrionaceae bacterium]|nr:ferrous iron transport protein A [Pseudobdellovibrionaceae bacterium]
MTLLDYAQTQIIPADLEITDFKGVSVICERLHEMGLHRGQKIRLIGRAPLKGPLIVQFGTSFLALRAEEAECTLIQAQ